MHFAPFSFPAPTALALTLMLAPAAHAQEVLDSSGQPLPNQQDQTVNNGGAAQSTGTGGANGQQQPNPIVGVKGLLHSLDDLDRPLSPEEITAYGATLQKQFPLTPELIRDYRRRIDESQAAAAAPPAGHRPRPINKTIRVSLDTNGPTPHVLTAPGVASVLSFFGSTGAPWPVSSFVVGREDAFEVYAMQQGSNQLAVAPLVAHGYSNLIISLVEEDQPIVVDLQTNEDRAHYKLDFSVNGRGPNAEAPVMASAEPKQDASSDIMMAFVQGVGIPKNAVPLSTDDGDVTAWRYDGHMYVRTNQTLMSPSWSQTLAGPGGIKAYRLRPAPVAIISRNGRMTKVRISQ